MFRISRKNIVKLSIDKLSPNISQLTFGEDFNQPVKKLPPNITHLTFDTYSNFNQSVDKLPSSLKYIEISKRYKDILPKNVEIKCF